MAKVVELINGNTDAMGNIVDVPEETETIAEPALSERDLRIHELEAKRGS